MLAAHSYKVWTTATRLKAVGSSKSICSLVTVDSVIIGYKWGVLESLSHSQPRMRKGSPLVKICVAK